MLLEERVIAAKYARLLKYLRELLYLRCLSHKLRRKLLLKLRSN